MRVAFVGAGTHLVSVLDSMNEQYEIVGVFDNLLSTASFHGIKKLGELYDFVKYRDKYDALMITIGDIQMREKLLQVIKANGISQFSVIDESAIVSKSAHIAEGCFVGKRVIVNAEAQIGKACIINSGSIIEHGCKLGENIHIAPGAVLCGNVEIQDHVLIGAASCVIQSLKIASHAVVGAGACVSKNIDCAGIYVGVPAKEKK